MLNQLKNINVARLLGRMYSDQASRNTALSVLQSLAGAVGTLLMYRFLMERAGLEVFGLWSLLSAGSSFGRVGDIGGGASLARYLASPGHGAQAASATYVHTVFLTTLTLMGTVAIALYFFAFPLIAGNIAPHLQSLARTLLPYALLCVLILIPLTSTLSAALDGLQRTDLRAMASITCTAVGLFLGWLLIPSYSALGFAISIVSQQALLIITLWWMLSARIEGFGFLPFRWRLDAFRETTGFGIRLQLNTVSALLTEPIAKIMLSSTAGLSNLAYYELALRLQTQLRGFIVAAGQPLVARAAAARTDSALQEILDRNGSAYMWSGALVCFALGSAIIPVYSLVALRAFHKEILTYSAMIASAYIINVTSVPSYYVAMGQGLMRWNVINQATAALILALSGHALSISLGPYGVVASMCLGIATGSAVAILGNYRHLIGATAFKPAVTLLRNSIFLAAACIGFAAILHFI